MLAWAPRIKPKDYFFSRIEHQYAELWKDLIPLRGAGHMGSADLIMAVGGTKKPTKLKVYVYQKN